MDIMGKKYYFFGISILILIVGIIGFVIHGGFNYDIQFRGGTVLEIEMQDNNFDLLKAEELVSKELNISVTASKSYTVDPRPGSPKLDLLIINVPSENGLSDDDRTKMFNLFKNNPDFKVKGNVGDRFRNVSPSIGKELRNNGFIAVIVSSILIIFYIWFRFRIMSGAVAGITAVIGLLHDVLIMLSVYTVLNIRMNESFIAAVLTIMGYSMNDTIIIYDRIRENSSMLKKISVSELVNRSIIQTLARSINTVVTVLICLITIYIFASISNISSIQEFALPLIVGVASGCYSSIFVSSPLWTMWKEMKEKRRMALKTAAKAS